MRLTQLGRNVPATPLGSPMFIFWRQKKTQQQKKQWTFQMQAIFQSNVEISADF